MHKKRQNDAQETTSRQPRCYSVEGLWFFELRGGGQHGPYESEQEMKAALNEFIALHHEFNAQHGNNAS